MKQLILASGSPRRKVLMDCMGLIFEVIPSKYDEQLDDLRAASEVAIELGIGKANDVAKMYPNAYVVGGDSIVVIDGKQVAKPLGTAEAELMLKDISNRTHQVVTSVVLVCIAKNIVLSKAISVDITFAELPQHIIDKYIATGDPYDKAGGYAKQHPILLPYLTNVDGDHHAATGLSTEVLREFLEEVSIAVPNDERKTRELFKKSSLAEQNILHKLP